MTGVAATIDGLHPGIRWCDGVVEVDGPLDADIDLAGRGLQLMPSLWTRPGFTGRWTQPTLVYPIGRFAWMAPTATKNHREPLAAALGTTRALVLPLWSTSTRRADLPACWGSAWPRRPPTPPSSAMLAL